MNFNHFNRSLIYYGNSDSGLICSSLRLRIFKQIFIGMCWNYIFIDICWNHIFIGICWNYIFLERDFVWATAKHLLVFLTMDSSCNNYRSNKNYNQKDSLEVLIAKTAL
jgi:hypothetical protein